MRCKGQISWARQSEAPLASRPRQLAQESARGGERGKRIEFCKPDVNWAFLLLASDPTVSGGNDGQEEEQTVGCLSATTGDNRKYAMHLLNQTK